MINYQFNLYSSLEKVFFREPAQAVPVTGGQMLKNEIHSFQLCGSVTGTDSPRIPLRLEIVSPLAPYITVKWVGYVPSVLPVWDYCPDPDYLSREPGLFPDPLFRIEEGEIELAAGQARAFWFAVEPRGEVSGCFPIEIILRDREGQEAGRLTYTLDILDLELPPLDIPNSCWFHGDCLGVLHQVSMGSDAYYALLDKYLDVYVKFGHNTLLTPIFTPPLDTAVGGERPTIQLVGVTLEKGKYTFDFSQLKRWIDAGERHGIQYFEMAHLFTQWGAQCAPKIMATVEGTYRKLFGWETAAASREYTAFLQAFLPELTAFLKGEGLARRCFFHISDEPALEHLDNYRRAREIVAPYLEDFVLIDALSDLDFYQTGLVTCPVVATNHLTPFREQGIEGLWAYYCCAQADGWSNRFMAMPSYRTRILGCQLYKYDIRGFLQWGFNFWYSQASTRVIDPFANTDADGGFPSGDAYLVYPCDQWGDPVLSLRLYLQGEAMQDLRALRLLETLEGREKTLALLEDLTDFNQYPRSGAYLLRLREEINRRLCAHTAEEGARHD